MEIRNKALRTINIKYPAAYTQSWIEEKIIKPKQTATIKKKTRNNNVIIQNPLHSRSWPKENVNRKCKKLVESPRVPLGDTQITYQMPFAKLIVPKTEKKNARTRKPAPVPRRISSKKVDRAVDPLFEAWEPTKASRAPDPTVKHLKYGLFPTTRRARNNDKGKVVTEGNSSRHPTRSEMSSLDDSSRKEKRSRKFKDKTDASTSTCSGQQGRDG